MKLRQSILSLSVVTLVVLALLATHCLNVTAHRPLPVGKNTHSEEDHNTLFSPLEFHHSSEMSALGSQETEEVKGEDGEETPAEKQEESLLRKATVYYRNKGSKHESYSDLFSYRSTNGDEYAKRYEIEYGVIDKENGVAFGSFDDTLPKIGWGVLNIVTNQKYADEMQMFAAGFLEGALTRNRIFEAFRAYTNVSSAEDLKIYRDYMKVNREWRKDKKEKHREKSPLWRQVHYMDMQIMGMFYGYNRFDASSGNVMFCKECQKLEFDEIEYQSAAGDVGDIITRGKMGPVDGPVSSSAPWVFDDPNVSDGDVEDKILQQSRCSSVIKLTPDMQDIFMAHATWFSYNTMNRIYKHYNFELKHNSVKSRKMSFSSYPGCIVSIDDFYLLGDTDMVMLQTTNSVFDKSVFSKITPRGLLSYHRVGAANRLSDNGKTWAKLVSEHNAGAYPNQYMIVDLKLFTPGDIIKDNTLWVVELVPGFVESADASQILEYGYWGSWNAPFFEKVYNVSGYPDMVKRLGLDSSYQLAPRAKILRRDQNKIVDLESMKTYIRSNHYETEPFSKGDPTKTVCARGDLSSKKASAYGCLDGKVTSSSMARQMKSYAVSGPTTSGGTLPIFSYSKQFPSYRRDGQPDEFDFGWQVMEPNWNPEKL
eukprot:Nk52_evm37s2118 gene=Nk52_evmTU37s2118